MKTIKALYLANAREFLRDRTSLFIIMLMPVALAVFFGVIFGSFDSGFTLQLGVVNENAGPAGEQFVDGLVSEETEEVLNLHTGTREEMEAALNKGWVSVVMMLPEDTTAKLAAGEPVTVEVLYDPTRPTSSGAGLGFVRTLLDEANLALSGAPRLLTMAERSVQTNPPRAIDFHMPGMLGVALFWLGLFGTALPLVQQREAQVLRRLSVTPLTPSALLTAQIAWRVTVGLIQAALFLLVGYVGFGVGVAGNKLLFVGAVVLGTLMFVSLGYFLTCLASSTEGVSAVVQIVNFPIMMLSGTLFTTEMLPSFFKPLVAVMPLTYLGDALRQLMIGTAPMHPLWLDFAVLGGWLVVLTGLAIKFWRWE
jgi:ABC-2 type transport system permease protein